MRKITAIPILLLATAFFLWSDPLVLDRDTCVNLALEKNPDFLISGIELDAADREYRNSWNSFLPEVSATVGLSESNSLFDSRDLDTSWSFSGSLDLSLNLSAGMANTIKSIRLAYESEQIDFELARISLISQVESGFYYLLASRKDMEIEKNNLDLAVKRYEQTKTNFENGFTSELSVLQARVSAENLKPDYLQTTADYDAEIRDFLIILGLNPDTEVVLEGDLKTEILMFDKEKLIDTYIGNRQDIRSLQNSLESAKNTKSMTALDSKAPSVQLSAGWNTNVSDAFENESWDSGSWQDGVSLGAYLVIPLDDWVPGSSTDTTLQSLEDSIESVAINLAKTTDTARAEIINLVDQLETTASQLTLSELNVELALESYRRTEDSYAKGSTERLDVEDAQQDYQSAEQSYILSQYNYISGLISLRTALGLEETEELIAFTQNTSRN